MADFYGWCRKNIIAGEDLAKLWTGFLSIATG
jgi:hypothetical protein